MRISARWVWKYLMPTRLPEAALVAASEPIVPAWNERANTVGVNGEAALKFYNERLADLSE